jgi:hypothetical protein
MSHNNKQPSKELLNHLVELKTIMEKLKDLYKTIDKKAIEEGFSIDEIYEIDASTKSVVATTPNNTITTNTTTKNNHEENEENKYFQRYFQHFQ